ncbi:hypothetical protein BH10PSE12_BH10PSE12_19270 [soil metagenome]
MRRALLSRYARWIDAMRAEHGLGPAAGALLIDADEGAALLLCCYAPLFAPLMPDAPAQAVTTGFPVFDSQSGAAEGLDPALEAFLNDGPPPIVFTLGSFAVFAPGNFYAAATAAAERLGRAPFC